MSNLPRSGLIVFVAVLVFACTFGVLGVRYWARSAVAYPDSNRLSTELDASVSLAAVRWISDYQTDVSRDEVINWYAANYGMSVVPAVEYWQCPLASYERDLWLAGVRTIIVACDEEITVLREINIWWLSRHYYPW